MDAGQVKQAQIENERKRSKNRENRREAMNVKGMSYNPGGRFQYHFDKDQMFACEQCVFGSGSHSCGK